MINFIILVWVLNKFVISPLNTFLEKRENTIKSALKEAEENQKDAQVTLENQKKLIKEAHQEAKSIRHQAEEAAKRERELIISQSQEDAKSILANANGEITKNYLNAKKILTEEMGNIAVNLTSGLLKKNIDGTTQAALIEESLEKVN